MRKTNKSGQKPKLFASEASFHVSLQSKSPHYFMVVWNIILTDNKWRTNGYFNFHHPELISLIKQSLKQCSVNMLKTNLKYNSSVSIKNYEPVENQTLY